MGSQPKTAGRTISQQAFDEVVKENIDDLGMDPTEALQDAIETLTLRGVYLSGIVTCVPGEGGVMDNPVIQCLDRLKQLDSVEGDAIVKLLDELTELCVAEGSGNAAIASRNGAVEMICSMCSKVSTGCQGAVVSALRVLALLLHDLQSREAFRTRGGPKLVVGVITDGFENIEVLRSGFSVIAAAATSNEVIKDSFMELKTDELILRALSAKSDGSVDSLYDAIRILLTPDDTRVLASQVYGYARKFAKIGIAGALVDSIRGGLSSPSLVSASIALKSVVVNMEKEKASWNERFVDVFCDLCIKEVDKGNRLNTHFNLEGWENIISGFRNETDSVNNYTGLGWDHRLQTIAADDEWWTKRIEKSSECAKFRKKGIAPEFEAKLNRMYLDISATGLYAYALSSGLPLPSSPKQGGNGDFLESSGDSDEVQPEAGGSSKRKRKSSTVEKGKGSVQKTGRVGGAALLAKKIDRMCEAIESRSRASSMINKTAVDPDTSIKEVMKVVNSLSGVDPGSRLQFFATRLFLSQEKREMFCTMEDPKIKLEWLKFEMTEK